MSRPVRVLLFASAREAVGRARLDRTIPTEGVGAEEFLRGLTESYPKLAPVLRISRLAKNGEIVAGRSFRLARGDELAIHPPYSGG